MNYVIGELRKIGYNPTLVPYANTSSPNAWSERTPSTLEVVTSPNQTTLPNGKTFVNGTAATSDFAQMTWSQSARHHRAGDPGRADPDPAARDRRHGPQRAAR